MMSDKELNEGLNGDVPSAEKPFKMPQDREPPVQERGAATSAGEATPAKDIFNIVEVSEKVVDEDDYQTREETVMNMNDLNNENFDMPALNNAGKKTNGSNKKGVIIVAVIAAVLIIAAGVYFGLFHQKPEEPTTTSVTVTEPVTEPVVEVLNPLTGEPEYNEAAVGKRPVAVVVENEYATESVKPQWGINDADIVMEGETEYSTRMLFFWADYTNMPEQIGPARSARPPFIRFSQLFDAVFVHAGLSHSKGNYVGADSVFESDKVDHINLLSLSENGNYFGRDKSRTSTIEHTGYFNGSKAADLIADKKIKTDVNEDKFTQFAFNSEAQPLSENEAKGAKFVWSNPCPKTGKFTYDEEKGIYTTADFDSRFGKASLEFKNLIFLLDTTEYVVKQNYKGSGKSETYCNYKLSGGKGKVLSEGTYVDITWKVENGKITMKTTDGEDVKLNRGKIYIGYGSSNHGGSIEITEGE